MAAKVEPMQLAFQHTAARRRLAHLNIVQLFNARFNTQPPEGGWLRRRSLLLNLTGFNTQPPEGGWLS